MKIIKTIELILIVVICTYLGIDKSKKFYKREMELKNLKTALDIFKTKINYTYETIKDIFNEISKMVYKDKENFFKKTIFLFKDLNINEAWEKSIEETETYITNEDKEVLKMLGKMLGKTDKDGQISQIELVNNFLDKQIAIAETEKQKNEKLYKTLGIVCGLVISIILV